MSLELFVIAAFGASLAGGVLGSLTGLGGGVIIVPVLVLLLGVDIRYAVGASLVAVIATSCGAAPGFLRSGLANLRLAIVLESATVVGAMAGALLAGRLDASTLSIVLGVVMIWSAWQARKEPVPLPTAQQGDTLAERLRLNSARGAEPAYGVRRVPHGLGIMMLAGVLSAIAGVGGGILKVLAMDRVMRVPFKASTSTSNLMIGVTAAASTGVYMHRGQVEPLIAGPVALGCVIGALIGARLIRRMDTRVLRVVFAVVVGLAGVQMIVRGWNTGGGTAQARSVEVAQ